MSATAKPAALQCGYAPGRTINGEQFHRAAYALAAITGNVGIPGGNTGVSNGATGRVGVKSFPYASNPIGARVASPLLADLLDRGKAGGYALQGYSEVYVRHIAGSYSNVVGLPLAETRLLLKSAGYAIA